MKKVLVLGSAGYLGKHLIARLLKKTDNVVYSADVSQVDLRDLSQCIRFFYTDRDYQEIYQLAANSGNMEYLLSSGYSYGDSTLMNINVIKALHTIDYEGKILFPSTFYAADTDNRYGLEKRYNEIIYLASGLDVRIPRLFSVYGPGEKLNSSGEKVTTAFCRRIIEKKDRDTIEIKGHPKQTRYFLHVDDAIKGLIAHMNSEIIECDLAGSSAISLKKLLKLVIKISGKRISVSWNNDWKYGDGWPVFYPDQNNLEWKPQTSFEDGMEKLYRWVDNELC